MIGCLEPSEDKENKYKIIQPGHIIFYKITCSSREDFDEAAHRSRQNSLHWSFEGALEN